MKKLILITAMLVFSGCTTLTRQESLQIRQLRAQGVTVDKPVGSFEKPANGVVAGLLNIFPGFGNFYLGIGNGAESSHILYGFGNLLFWPLSIVWSIPEAAIDADNINKREMLYYYTYDAKGKQELEDAKITLTR